MPTWEYRVVMGSKDGNRVQYTCDQLGVAGWELAGVTPILVQYDQGGFGIKKTATDWFMIFKRQVHKEPAV
jgi:hypothetical protein